MRPQCVNDPATARTHEDVAEEHSKTIKCKRRLQEVSDRDERCEISVPLTLSKCAKNGSRSLVGQKKRECHDDRTPQGHILRGTLAVPYSVPDLLGSVRHTRAKLLSCLTLLYKAVPLHVMLTAADEQIEQTRLKQRIAAGFQNAPLTSGNQTPKTRRQTRQFRQPAQQRGLTWTT